MEPSLSASQVSTPPAALNRPIIWLLFLGLGVALFGNYYSCDSIAPIAKLLQTELNFSSTQVGALNAVYSLPNIVLVFFVGILCDRIGYIKVLLGAAILSALGALLVVATSHFWVMVLGRFFFGIGSEGLFVSGLVALAFWLRGGWLAFGMALSAGLGRFGSYTADVSPSIFPSAYASGWREPQWISLGFSLLCLAAIVFCYVLVTRSTYVRSLNHALPTKAEKLPSLAWREMFKLDRSFWYLLILCATFYSSAIVFRSTFAIDYFQNAHKLPLQDAGHVNSYVFLAAAFFTPIFGFINDKIGRHGVLLVVGALASMGAFGLLAMGSTDLMVVTVLMGLCYSLIPAVIWPAVSLTVPAVRLGLVFGIMDAIQNLFLTVVNLGAGRLNDINHASIDNPEGYGPMLWLFLILSVIGFISSLLFGARSHKKQSSTVATL